MTYIKLFRLATLSIVLSLALSSCDKSLRRADISGIDLDVRVGRFDKAFWAIDTLNIEPTSAALKSEFPEMANIYLNNVLRFGHPDSAATWHTYRLFRRHSSVDTLYNDVLTKFPDSESFDKELTMAFRRAKYFFPALETPNVYFHVSGFNQSLILGPSFISLSLDNYMGADYDVYAKVGGIYEYQRYNMKPEKIVPDLITGWLSSSFPQDMSEKPLIDEMIFRGKILYAVNCLLPDEMHHILMGYSPEQWDWSLLHERHMWGTLIANKDLYSQDIMKNGGYLNDGPFTVHFSQDSPSRGGVFLGWRIVTSFMKNNPEVSLLDLMNIQSSDAILQQSGYNPK